MSATESRQDQDLDFDHELRREAAHRLRAAAGQLPLPGAGAAVGLHVLAAYMEDDDPDGVWTPFVRALLNREEL